MKKQSKETGVKLKRITIDINGVNASPYVTAYLTPEEFEKAKEKIDAGEYEVETLANGKIAVSRFYPDFQKRVETGFDALSEEDVTYYATSEYITSEFRDIERADIMTTLGLQAEKTGGEDRALIKALKASPEDLAALKAKYGIGVKK